MGTRVEEEVDYKGPRELSGAREMFYILVLVVITCLHVLPKLRAKHRKG